jgi:CBS domain-containing protein/sporulation protein YlmC with PRC-barrel domain
MLFFAGYFLSAMLDKPVRDRSGRQLGRLKDLAIRCVEGFPPVSTILVRASRHQELVVPWDEVRNVSSEAITLESEKDQLVPGALAQDECWLARSILDRQMVDLRGRRLVRVNDLEIAYVGGAVRLVAVDAGSRGFLRRLGLERIAMGLFRLFGRQMSERLLSWEHVMTPQPMSEPLQLGFGQEALAKMRPADLADIASQLGASDRATLFRSLDEEKAADTLQEMSPRLQVSVLNSMDDERASDILEEMVPDDAADLLADLPEERADELLELMEADEAADVKQLLSYPEDSAGGLMTTEFVALPQDLTADQAIARLREEAPDAETVYYVYVTDEAKRLVGVLSLRHLIVAAPDRPISELMERDAISVAAETGHDELAPLMAKYNLLALPVVDEQGLLLGIVTVDDAMDGVLEEHKRRVLRGVRP